MRKYQVIEPEKTAVTGQLTAVNWRFSAGLNDMGHHYLWPTRYFRVLISRWISFHTNTLV